MKVHHLNCISSCPLCGKLFNGHPDALLRRGHLACHCLLVESPDGLVLVDTGFGLRDVADPYSRLSKFFLLLLKPEFRREMTAIRQIERLGFRASDVRHIVMTHLDFDHAGGLDDFPDATVHMLATERDYAAKQKTWLDRQRFRPQQWSYQQMWQVHSPRYGDRWEGFTQVCPVAQLANEIALIPLAGHTYGHAGVAVRRDGGWLLLAGDAYFDKRELDPVNPRCAPGLRFYQWMLEKDRDARLQNQQRLRDLTQRAGAAVTVCCSHDVDEFERLAGRSAALPAERLVMQA
ncbi:MBL fold metallo-hydrolase [Paraburkholderia sp.]|jgi:glyoxylase-like metal-dependent hydrolase (beta-lactamase superfamily II)|uniref:MBL fold metallo-hydrolase n=1 Tax=Paraburkholderia sp. TaxID=1926495 RepID=UPI002F3F07DB